jgi:hypothetical protein
MMVSVLLAAVLSAGLFYMTSGQQRTYTAQIDTLQLQESLWGAMEYLKRQVRGAGRKFGGCRRGKVYDGDPGNPANAVIHAMRIFNGCSVSGSVTLNNASAIDACTATDVNTPDSFSVTVIGDRSPATNGLLATQVTRRPAGNTLILPIVHGSQVGFPSGDQIIVYPFGDTTRSCMLRTIGSYTGPSPPAQPFGTLATTSPNGRGDPTRGYFIGTLVVALGTPGVSIPPYPTMPASPAPPLLPRYFAIDNTKGYPRLITWTSADPTQPSNGLAGGSYDVVAEGIEDMQISWACDLNDDGLLNEGQNATARASASDEWAFNADSDTIPDCDWRTPAAVRITLIARTRIADPRYKIGFRPAAEDRTAGTIAEDQTASKGKGTFARRVLTVVVKPENMQQPTIVP